MIYIHIQGVLDYLLPIFEIWSANAHTPITYILLNIYFFRFKIFAKVANTFLPHKYQTKILDASKQEPNGMPTIDIKGILGTYITIGAKRAWKVGVQNKDSRLI